MLRFLVYMYTKPVDSCGVLFLGVGGAFSDYLQKLDTSSVSIYQLLIYHYLRIFNIGHLGVIMTTCV